MKIFQKFKIYSEEEAFSMDLEKALLVLLYKTIMADRVISKKEEQTIDFIVAKCPVFTNETYDKLRHIMRLVETFAGQNPDSLEQACKVIKEKKYERLAVALCCETIFADSLLTRAEVDFIRALMHMLEVEEGFLNCCVSIFAEIYGVEAEGN